MGKEKKEIGKLIELLNEYELGEDYGDMGEYYYIDTLGNIVDDGGYILKPCEIISKKFGFIKWLVENDKIDLGELEYSYQDVLYELETAKLIKDKSDFLSMLLSVQDNPIDFLISILK